MRAGMMAPVWTATVLAAMGGLFAAVSYKHDAFGLLGVLGLQLLAIVVVWTLQQRRPDIVWVAYAASMATLPLAAGRIPIAGLLVPPPALIAALAMVILAVRAMLERRADVVPSRAYAWLALILLGFAISVPFARTVDPAHFAKWIFHGLLVVLLGSMTERRYHLLTAQALALATGGLAVYGLVAYVRDERYDVNFYHEIGSRGATGMHLAIVLPLLLGLIGMRGSGTLRRSLFTAAAVLCVCALALTYARAAWVALLVALLVMAIVGRQGLPLLGLLVLAVGLSVWAPAEVQERFATIFSTEEEADDASVTNALRLELAGQAIALIKDNPIVGVGLGNYARSIPWYLYVNASYSAVPHNAYLLTWAEGGVLALLGLLGFLWTIGKQLLRALGKTTIRSSRALLLGLLGSWTAVVTFMLFGDDINHLLVWTALGLGISAARVWRDEPATVGEPHAVRPGLRPIGASVHALTVGKGA